MIDRDASRGQALRRLRRTKGWKQLRLAEGLGVNQSTVARWENGSLELSEDGFARARRLLQVSPAQDDVLRRLVETSTQQIHLICDVSHRLLAASPAREAAWRIGACDLLGTPLIGFASEEILQAEAGLDGLGWHEGAVSSLTVTTRSNHHPLVPIKPGRCRWDRLHLGDGSAARLVTTLA